MKSVSQKMKKYMFDSKVSSLSSIMSVIKHDIKHVLSDYMNINGEPVLIADIDEKTGGIVLSITVRSDEIYESGNIVK